MTPGKVRSRNENFQFEETWKQYLHTLEGGGSLQPDPGLVGDREYLSAQIVNRYGSFKGLRILGAGCGTGRIEAWLGHQGADVVCLDHSVEALRVSRIQAQRSQSNEHFALGDLTKIPFVENTFNCIYSGGVLEHFEDISLPLDEYFRVTRPGGVIIVSVPNLVGVNASYGYKPLTEPLALRFRGASAIEKNFSARSFRQPIQAAGFDCLDISPTFFNTFDYFPFKRMRTALSAIGLYAKWCRLLDRFGHKFPGVAFGYSFMIALAEKPKR